MGEAIRRLAHFQYKGVIFINNIISMCKMHKSLCCFLDCVIKSDMIESYYVIIA